MNMPDETMGVQGGDVVTKLSPWSVVDTVTPLLAVVACQRANGVRDDRSQRRSGERWIAPPRHQANADRYSSESRVATAGGR